MKREEIIEKVETLLHYHYNELNKYSNRNHIKSIAQRALAQLDALFIILDEEWDGYDEWFNKFYPYI
jgi:hypothetical protein